MKIQPNDEYLVNPEKEKRVERLLASTKANLRKTHKLLRKANREQTFEAIMSRCARMQ